MTQRRPTPAQFEVARTGVAVRGRHRSRAPAHEMYRPRIREHDRRWLPCEHWHARRNPARGPVFADDGRHAGRLLWTCSTSKVAQVDRPGVAPVLVVPPT